MNSSASYIDPIQNVFGYIVSAYGFSFLILGAWLVMNMMVRRRYHRLMSTVKESNSTDERRGESI